MTTEAKISKFLPERMLEITGKNLPAIFKAVDDTHEKIEILIQACIDQLFLTTASGRFLIQLGEQEGFTLPANSGLDIRAYKTLVPIAVSNPKQIRQSINELIQAFYGSDRTKPTLLSSVASPYALTEGDDITIETESSSVTIVLTAGQVSDFSSVTAGELAAIINSTQLDILATTTVDRTTGLNYLQIISSSSGSGASIRIAGGKLQNVVMFPNIVKTDIAPLITWNIVKISAYSDEIKFTWNGAGTNPLLFKTRKDDVVTIRGLVDGLDPFSQLNGSYKVVDSGYDYFIIRSTKYAVLSSTLIQPVSNNIVFTSKDKINLYAHSEFALTSETVNETITLTVPAIPPLARRFLAGSAHLHGHEQQVIDFSRNSIKINIQTSTDRPVADNRFVLSNAKMRHNFRYGRYKTTSVDSNLTTPTYTVDSSNEEFLVLPYTVPVVIGIDPITATIDSAEYYVDFSINHGLLASWGFTLGSATGLGNITALDLNKEHETVFVANKKRVKFKLYETNGDEKKFSGVSWGPADLYQYTSLQSNGADFYLQFSSFGALTASGLIVGMLFKLDSLSGVDTVPFLATQVKYRQLYVTGISGNNVQLSAGIGPGLNGSIITGVTGKRSGVMGGTPTYFLDKTTPLNIANVLTRLSANMLAYTQSSNPAYVGSFIYDSIGEKTSVTVSKFAVKLTDTVFKGENIISLFVDSVTVGGEDFPQSGELIIDYGTDDSEGPIRYFAIIQNGPQIQILTDQAYRFKHTHKIGAQVQYLRAAVPYNPTTTGSDYPFYITGTAQARNTMFAIVDLLIAAGIFVEKDVVLPDLRYDDSSILPFE